MPTGTWRRRRPLPPPPGTEHVVPIGDATPTQKAAYAAAREAERQLVARKQS